MSTDPDRFRRRVRTLRRRLDETRREAKGLAARIARRREDRDRVRRGETVTDEDGVPWTLDRISDAIADDRERYGRATGRRDQLTEELTDELATFYDASTAASRDPDRGLDLLDGRQPIALLPVRVETAFRDAQLLVRVYPEPLHVDTHEAELTPTEEQWGRSFWQRVHRATDPTESATLLDLAPDQPLASDPAGRHRQIVERAWIQLTDRFDVERAAWIKHQTAPSKAERLLSGPFLDSASVPDLDLPADVPQRPAAWAEPPTAALLPDRWTAAVWNDGNLVKRVTAENPIREPLPVGPEPDLTGETRPEVAADNTPGADEPHLDPGMDWMADFDEARAAGMGFVVPLEPELSPAEIEAGINRLLVYGVRASTGSQRSAQNLRDHLTGQRYTDGLSFIPTGTSTNNTRAESAGYTSRRSIDDRQFDLECRPARVTGGADDLRDGAVVARALGIDETTGAGHPFARVPNADGTDQRDARWANRLVWPATAEYYAYNLLVDAGWSDVPEEWNPSRLLSWVEATGTHFAQYVRADGPLPTFRVERQPYGILPVTPLDSWDELPDLPTVRDPLVLSEDVPRSTETTPEFESRSFVDREDALPRVIRDHLRDARQVWERSFQSGPTPDLPHFGRGEFATDAAGVLGMSPTACGYYLRRLFGYRAAEAVGPDAFDVDDEVMAALSNAGVDWWGTGPTGAPRIARFRFGQRDGRISDVVGPDAASVVRALGDAGYQHRAARADTPADSLFQALVEAATLRAYIATRARLGELYARRSGVPPDPELYEQDDPTVWDRLEETIPRALAAHPDLDNQIPYWEAIDLAGDISESRPEIDLSFRRFTAALRGLAGVDADEYERLVTGSLDLTSHRFDAWATSLATRRLDALRAHQHRGPAEAGQPGVHMGAYSLVENLRPRDEDRSRGGYVHAPSMQQATTAAVLRGGHIAYAGDPEGELLALDLTSERVRTATDLLAGVRGGQRLGALLGHRFERRLVERTDHLLGQYVPSLREFAPFRAPEEEAEPATERAPESVVDGLALYRRWQDSELPETEVRPDYPLPTGLAREALEAEIRAIGEDVNAVRDLLTAESVHQVVADSEARAAGSVDALATGEVLPDPQFTRTPQSGTAVTHRVLVLFDDPVLRSSESTPVPETTGGWPAPGDRHVRHEAEPTLDRWVGALLGDPTRVVCRVAYLEPEPPSETMPPEERTVLGEATVRLSELGLRPLDVVAAAIADEGAQRSEIQQRVAYHALRARPSWVPAEADVDITFGRFDEMAPADVSFAAFLETSHRIGEAVGGSRAATAEDARPPEEVDPDAPESEGLVDAEVLARLDSVTASRTALEASLTALSGGLTRGPPGHGPPNALALERALTALVALPTGALERADATLVRAESSSLADQLSDLATRLDGLTPVSTVGKFRTAVNDAGARSVVDLFAQQALVEGEPELARLADGVDALLSALDAVDPAALQASWEAVRTSDAVDPASLPDPAAMGSVLQTLAATADAQFEADLSVAAGPLRVAGDADALHDLRHVADADAGTTLGETGVDLAALGGALDSIRLAFGPERPADFARAVDDLRSSLATHRATLDDVDVPATGAAFRASLAEAVRNALLRAAHFGVNGAVPRSATGASEATLASLGAQAETARDALADRKPSLGASPTQSERVEAIEAVLDASFPVAVPFQPANVHELAQTFNLDHGRRLQDGNEAAVEAWFERASRVRDRLWDLSTAFTEAEALTETTQRHLHVGQLPYRPDDRWVGLPADGERHEQRLSLVAQFADSGASDGRSPVIGGGPIAGFLVDEWVETIPSDEATTAVTFDYDVPDNAAPQSILLAIPPNDNAWTAELVEDSVREALNLATLRGVDLDAMDDLGHVLPATCVPENSAGTTGYPDAVSTPLAHLLNTER